MATENSFISPTWVDRPAQVTIEYTDGAKRVETETTAIDAKHLSDRAWVDVRFGEGVASITIDFLDRSDEE